MEQLPSDLYKLALRMIQRRDEKVLKVMQTIH